MRPIFSELDHRLSVVKRWNILHTIQEQSVAEHAFNVQRIAMRIAREWFSITDNGMLLEIAEYSHEHDNLEALSGDINTMAKAYFDEAAMAEDHADLIPIYTPFNMVKQIVKLADMLEGYHFLCIEMTMGNSYVERHWAAEPRRIIEYCNKAFGKPIAEYNEIQRKVYTTMEQFRGEKSTRFSRRGR